MGAKMETFPSRAEKNPQDQRIRRTYRALIKAVEQLLCETTVEHMTVKQICAAAKIQRTTFYQHFQNMEDFLNWYIQQKQQEFRSFSSGRIPAEQANQAFLDLAKSIMHYLNENECLVRNLMNTQMNGKPLFDLYLSTCVDDLMSRLEDAPKLEQLAGDTPLRFLVEFYVGGMISVFRWWIVNDKPITEQEFMRYLRTRIERATKE